MHGAEADNEVARNYFIMMKIKFILQTTKGFLQNSQGS